jgi:alpha-glucosidase
MKITDIPFLNSIHHDGSERYVLPSNNPIQVGDEVVLRLRHHPSLPVERVFLRSAPDGEQEVRELEPGPSDPAARWWQIRLTVPMPLFHYRFLFMTTHGPLWLNARGLQFHQPTDLEDFKLLAGLQSPSWIQDAVFYQIFPDRFADGDPSNNVQSGEFTYRDHPAQAKAWGEPATTSSLADLVTFFGGDLQGITQKLDVLADLGVNAIYLNPVFSSFSNHRYDVTDYFNVDPHLGGNSALAELRERTRQRGMRVILDIVPNHCGVAHPWFQQALSDCECETAEYFTFNRHPDDYVAWLGVKTLPKFNYQSKRLREVMYRGAESVFRYWLKPPFSMDGWRIDVANMLARQGENQLNHEVGQEIRQAVKAANPDAYLLGENFFDATPQLQGDFLDASMNYSGFSKPVWFWLGQFEMWPQGSKQALRSPTRWSTQAFAETLAAFRATIPWQSAVMQFNLLGSHDTPRIATVLNGDAAHIRLAVALLLTYPGVPSIYYGDEIGLQGDGKHNRETMPWDTSRWDLDLRAYHQTLIELRKTSTALTRGGFQVLAVEEDTFAFLRDSQDDQIIVLAQRGPNARPAGPLDVAAGGFGDGSQWQELFTGQRLSVQAGRLDMPEIPPGPSIWRKVN